MSICAIIVTYNPDVSMLLTLIESVDKQVDVLCIVDNGSSADFYLNFPFDYISNFKFIKLEDNFGLGTALNKGIELARKLGMEFVLFLDQDSICSQGMVSCLVKHYKECTLLKVAEIGPRFIDINNSNISQHVNYRTLRVGHIPCPEKLSVVQTDVLITSGSLIPIHVLDFVGPMDESLFIDHIDTEWCLRAKSKGYVLLGDCEALMSHNLGEYRKRIWFIYWREVPVHKAFRYYYIFRNSVLLYHRKYVPWSWIRIDLIRLIEIFGFTLLFGPYRLDKITMMFQGIRDAFLGKTGKLPSCQNRNSDS